MSGILSLCTGYAGLDLAVEAVTGARTVAVSDLDKGANKILAHRLPDVPNLGDLKLIDWTAWAGIDVMTAGYPCQPFSHAGKREGTDDPRHIFPNIAEGIRVVGPRLVVLENVQRQRPRTRTGRALTGRAARICGPRSPCCRRRPQRMGRAR